MTAWLGPGDEIPRVDLNIHTLEVNLLGEHFRYRFILDEETFNYPIEVQHLAERLHHVVGQMLKQRFEREQEKFNERNRH